MAITRTQIAKQLLAQGGRTGFQGGGFDMGQEKGSVTGRDPRDDKQISNRMAELNRENAIRRKNTLTDQQIQRAKNFRDLQKVKSAFTKKTFMDKFPNITKNVLGGIFKGNVDFRKEFAKNNPDLLDYINSLTEEEQSSGKLMTALDEIGYGDFLADVKGAPGLKFAGNVGGLGTKSAVRDIDGNIIGFKYDEPGGDRGDPSILLPQGIMAEAPSDMDQELEEEEGGLRLAFRANGGRIGFRIGSGEGKDVSGREYGGPPGKGSGSNDRDRRRVEQYTKPPTVSGGGGGNQKTPNTPLSFKKDIPDSFAKKFSVGDLINFGLLDENEQSQPLFADASLNQDELNIQKALGQKTYTDAINEVLSGGKITAGGEITNTVPDLSNPDVLNKIAIDAGLPTEKKGIIGVRKDVATPGSSSAIKSIQNLKRNPDLKFSLDDVIDTAPENPTLKDLSDEQIKNIYNVVSLPSQNRFAAAEGGMPYDGGIMDLESARQMYGLGKLVKKVTRTVKKIAKSPIGKAALLYAGTAGLGSIGSGLTGFARFAPSNFMSNVGRIGSFISGGFPGKNIVDEVALTGKKNIFQKIIGGIPGGITTAIAGASALAGLLTPAQEEEAQELSRGEGIDIEAARRMILQAGTSADKRGLAFRAEGGRIGYQEGSKEPVAKKTMPLLDMGGKEMDLREDGGFVPIGRMEKADDVPARLSKNEFVFTADAVRNAGDGDVDKGAEVMYNMMKNLESGGDVSEESQGLEGARKMFQTSQRLEEVL